MVLDILRSSFFCCFLAIIYIMIFNNCPFICCIIFTLLSILLHVSNLKEFALGNEHNFLESFSRNNCRRAEKNEHRQCKFKRQMVVFHNEKFCSLLSVLNLVKWNNNPLPGLGEGYHLCGL